MHFDLPPHGHTTYAALPPPSSLRDAAEFLLFFTKHSKHSLQWKPPELQCVSICQIVVNLNWNKLHCVIQPNSNLDPITAWAAHVQGASASETCQFHDGSSFMQIFFFRQPSAPPFFSSLFHSYRTFRLIFPWYVAPGFILNNGVFTRMYRGASYTMML